MGLISSPFIILQKLLKQKNKYLFVSYLIIGIIISIILIVISAWWGYESNKILLTHYGYNFEGMNEIEDYKQVSAKNLVRVKSLETSMMGIGWPLKAIFLFIFYLPYLFITYFLFLLIEKITKKKHRKAKI